MRGVWSGVFVLVAVALVGLLQGADATADAANATNFFTVYYNPTDASYSVLNKKDPISGVAWAEYGDERYESGWARLNADTNPIYSDEIKAYGLGYLEGVITVDLIWVAWYNMQMNKFGDGIPTKLADYFQANKQWTEKNAATLKSADPYWAHVSLVLAQLQGILDGYNNAVATKAVTTKYHNSALQPQKLTWLEFAVQNADGDLETLFFKYNITNSLASAKSQMRRQTSHCSSLIKVTPDLSELYSGHTTWESYYWMVRIFKTYTLRLTNTPKTAAVSTLFSSYPAALSSIDDFYQLSSKLVVIETTNGIYNTDLLKYVTPESVLSWIRVIVANRMANSGPEWTSIFSRYNSGTYNNQWIVVDYKLFKPRVPLAANLLWIVEQVPGYVEAADATSFLSLGHWPSYNVPFFPKIYNMSGWPALVAQDGYGVSYSLAPRAQIFRRDSDLVTTLDQYKAILRYNNWQKDPLSLNNPGHAISSRYDLEPVASSRAAFGGVDSKVTSLALINAGLVHAQSGPTHDQQVPFDWTVGDWKDTHEGQPSLWNFGWYSMPQGTAM